MRQNSALRGRYVEGLNRFKLKSHWNSYVDLNGAACHWHWLSNSNHFISSQSDIHNQHVEKENMLLSIYKKKKNSRSGKKGACLQNSFIAALFHFCNSRQQVGCCLNWKQIGIGAPGGCPVSSQTARQRRMERHSRALKQRWKNMQTLLCYFSPDKNYQIELIKLKSFQAVCLIWSENMTREWR